MENYKGYDLEESVKYKHVSVTVNEVPHPTRLHRHNYFEIELVLEGKFKHLLNDTVYEMIPGYLYVLSPSDFHQLYDIEEKGKVINIRFDFAFNSHNYVTSLLNKSGDLIFKLNKDETEKAKTIASQLKESCDTDDQYSEEDIKNKLESLLIFILRRTYKSTFLVKDQKPIQKVLDYLYIHYKDSPSIVEVSKKYGYSPDYFGKQFKSFTGRTYGEFLTSLKLNYAKILLLTTDMSVIDISTGCGFATVSNFNRAFRKEMGCSPTNYAKKNKNTY